MDKILRKGLNGEIEQFNPIEISTGSGDAGKIFKLRSDGKIDESLLPPGITPDLDTFIAFENIAAGDFVNIFSDAGVAKIRKADASTISKKAYGYVLIAVTTGNIGFVYYDDKNNQLSLLAGGTEYFLSATVPGGITSIEPSTTGFISQKVGIASSVNSMHVNIQRPIILV